MSVCRGLCTAVVSRQTTETDDYVVPATAIVNIQTEQQCATHAELRSRQLGDMRHLEMSRRLMGTVQPTSALKHA